MSPIPFIPSFNPKDDKVIAVVPAYNEEGKIGSVVKKLKACGWVDEVVVVDDGSTDKTPEEAQRMGASVVRQHPNRGVGAALRSGFKAACAKGASTLVVLGGDDQDNPEEIDRLLKPLREGYDFVQGSRWMEGGRTEHIPWFRSITTRVYSMIFQWVTGCRCTDATNGFRAFRSQILDGINLNQDWLNTYELEPYLLYQAAKRYRLIEVPVTKHYPANRNVSYTKMTPFKDWWRILRPLIYLAIGIKK